MKKCVGCGRKFDFGISNTLCSNSCKKVVEMRVRERMRNAVQSVRKTA